MAHSNVEFSFILKDDKNKSEISKLAEILELKIMNLGETYFNLMQFSEDESPEKSFSSNGFRTVLSSHELIGTAKQLAIYQSDTWFSRHQEELPFSITLSHSTRLMGDERLYRNYIEEVQKALNEKLGEMSLFSSRQKCREKRAKILLPCSINPVIQRESQLLNSANQSYHSFQTIVDSLSLHLELKHTTTLERIKELREKRVISLEGEQNLIKALSFAIGLKIRADFFYANEENAQTDFPISPEESAQISELQRIVKAFYDAAINFVHGDKRALQLSLYQTL